MKIKVLDSKLSGENNKQTKAERKEDEDGDDDVGSDDDVGWLWLRAAGVRDA